MLVHPGPETANRFLAFVNASPTPFHAVANAAVLLENAGFRKVSSRHLDGSAFTKTYTDQGEG
jgi:aspartyl aminopeptidase